MTSHGSSQFRHSPGTGRKTATCVDLPDTKGRPTIATWGSAAGGMRSILDESNDRSLTVAAPKQHPFAPRAATGGSGYSWTHTRRNFTRTTLVTASQRILTRRFSMHNPAAPPRRLDSPGYRSYRVLSHAEPLTPAASRAAVTHERLFYVCLSFHSVPHQRRQIAWP